MNTSHHTGSASTGLFFTMGHAAQARRVRELLNAGFTEHMVSDLTGWSLNDIRRAVAEAGKP